MNHSFFSLLKIRNFLLQAAAAVFLCPVAVLAVQPFSSQEDQQRKEIGLHFVQNFGPKDYGAGAQNWAIVQDKQGLMYFGNSAGVLQFDGVSWRAIPTANASTVRSLDIDADGRIFVGAQGEIGYLAVDPHESDSKMGRLRYVSLLNHIPEDKRDFSDVWETCVTSGGVFFRTNKRLFRWRDDGRGNGKMTVWVAEATFDYAFSVHDTLYVGKTHEGLWRIVDDSLRQAPDNERLSGEYVAVMLPFVGQTPPKSLAATGRGNLSVYDGGGFENFDAAPEAKELLRKYRIFRGAVMADSSFVINMLGAGAVVLDQQGAFTDFLNKKSGLRDEDIFSAFSDREGGLWLAFNNGLARIETPSRLTEFGETHGAATNFETMIRHNDVLYAASGIGPVYFSPPESANETGRFEHIVQQPFQAFDLALVNESLFAAGASGTYLIDQKARTLVWRQYAYSLEPSRYNEKMVFIGLQEGMAVLQQIGGEWRYAGRVKGVTEQIRTITEEAPGVLWLGTRNRGVVRLRIPDLNSPQPLTRAAATADYDRSAYTTTWDLKQEEAIEAEVDRFGAENGLPDGHIYTYFANKRVYFVSLKGLKFFDEKSRRFLPDSSLGEIFADTTCWVNPIVEGDDGKIWLTRTVDNKTTVYIGKPTSGGSYDWDGRPFRRMSGEGVAVNGIYLDEKFSDVAWFCTSEGVVRYDASIHKKYDVNFPALVRRVIINGDSAIYFGDRKADRRAMNAPVLNYQNNALRFEYAALSFERPGANRFQVFLQGFDETWSGWTNETQKDYTNLPEGDYAFRVRAENVYGHLSKEDAFAFSILPPWYRTVWAYVFYVIFIAGALYSFVRLRLQRLRQQKRELEAVVADRTMELAEKNEKLQEMDRIKSRFFANISHEFRTPLTLVLGQIDNVLPSQKDKRNVGKLKMAHRNGVQLLRMINQLLDLSKIEAGKMNLNGSPRNIVPVLRALTHSFESLAWKKKIQLSFKSEEETVIVNFEQDKIEKIMHNLLSNAMKFTPDDGRVSVLLTVNCKPKSVSGQSTAYSLQIYVRDSGIGIPADRLPQIFDRFFQADHLATREYEGTGIGLALTKELVELHGGSISVKSEIGKGSTFVVHLPVAREAGEWKTENGGGQSEEDRSSSNEDTVSQESATQFNVHSEADSSERDVPSSVPHSPSSVLIIEDNDDVRQFIRDGLEENYNVLEAPDGEQGLAKAQEKMPDLIITDVMMPKMDGYALVRRLREDPLTSHIPIIMVTAKAAEEERLEGLESGVDAYLVKPFNTKELHVRVRKLIELRQKLREQWLKNPKISVSEIAVASADQRFLDRLLKIAEENMGEENFTIDDLSVKAGMSKRQLNRKLKALLDCSASAYLRTVRLERAKQLLEQSAGTVSEIAFEVGFSHTSAFTRAFRDAYGKPPKEFLGK